MNISGKFCPVCKNKNLRTATVCKFCGALLDENLTNGVTTTQNSGEQTNLPTEGVVPYVDVALIPERGIGVYIAGSFKPQYLRMDAELIIGRNTDNSPETFLDLVDQDAFNMGISRRHAVIRRAKSGFEVVDLSSTNGTWLNAERLVPNRPYPLASGSQLRLGRLRLFVIYNSDLKGTKKK